MKLSRRRETDILTWGRIEENSERMKLDSRSFWSISDKWLETEDDKDEIVDDMKYCFVQRSIQEIDLTYMLSESLPSNWDCKNSRVVSGVNKTRRMMMIQSCQG